MEQKVVIVEESENKRLDVFVSEELDITRSYVKQLIEKGKIKLNENIVKSGKIVKAKDTIIIEIDDPIQTILPQNIPLDILYEDEDIAVINKQQGLSVHPGGGECENTLVNALMYHLSSLSTINGEIRPGIVHRLDKDTSGVMVVAKNDNAHLKLANQIANREVTKIYVGLCEGVFKEKEDIITTKIGRSPKDRKLMAITSDGRIAITKYKVIKNFVGYSLVEFNILTGRTHQIRVHAKYLNHPIIGDLKYGLKKQKFNLNGQLLHSKELTFTHPRTNKKMTFTAKIPDYFQNVLDKLTELTEDK